MPDERADLPAATRPAGPKTGKSDLKNADGRVRGEKKEAWTDGTHRWRERG